MTPSQKLRDLLIKKFATSAFCEQDDNTLSINFPEENVHLKLRIWDVGGKLIVQFKRNRCHIPDELSELINKINDHIQIELNKKGSHKEDIAKISRSIIPSNVFVRRDGNMIGFFVNQNKAIEVAEILEKFFLKK